MREQHKPSFCRRPPDHFLAGRFAAGVRPVYRGGYACARDMRQTAGSLRAQGDAMAPNAMVLIAIAVRCSGLYHWPLYSGGSNVEKRGAPIVYVVDDDADVRDGLRALFESVDLRCEVFGSAAQFLARKVLDEVSCLVLDVRLPGLSGLD